MQDWNLIQKTFAFAPENELNAVKNVSFLNFQRQNSRGGQQTFKSCKIRHKTV